MTAPRSRLLAAVALVIAAGLAPAPGAGTQPLPYQSRATSLGVVSCASDLCHGAVSPWKGSNVLQNEYVTWSRVDKHATRAYQALLDRALAPHRGQPGPEGACPSARRSASTAMATSRRQRSAASASR